VRILLVEERADVRQRYRQVLLEVSRDLMFGEAATARQVGDLIGRSRWDAVVVGVGSRTSDGLDAVRETREADSSVPIVVILESAAPSLAREAVAAGANVCVAAESQPELLAAVRGFKRRPTSDPMLGTAESARGDSPPDEITKDVPGGQMRIESQVTGGIVLLTVEAARLDSAVVGHFVQAVKAALDGARYAAIDLSRIPFLDSTALGALIGLRKSLGQDGALAIVGAQPAVVNLFRLTRLDTVFPMFATSADAVQAMERT
jgi:anti-sigma B factor antagonist